MISKKKIIIKCIHKIKCARPVRHVRTPISIRLRGFVVWTNNIWTCGALTKKEKNLRTPVNTVETWKISNELAPGSDVIKRGTRCFGYSLFRLY